MNGIIGLEWRKRSIMRSIKNQISYILGVIRRAEIAYPLAWFSASIRITPLLIGTMFFYHTRHLKIHPHILELAKVVGQMSLLLGSYIYNRFLKLHLQLLLKESSIKEASLLYADSSVSIYVN